MAKKKAESVATPMREPERPRFSVSFHADGDSMEDLRHKMGKAFAKGGLPKDEAAEHRAERGGRGRKMMKRAGKKKMGRRR